MAAAAARAGTPGGWGGGGSATASHRRRHLSNRLLKPLREWGEGEGRGSRRAPREHARALSQSEPGGRTPAQARCEARPAIREALPHLSPVQTKQGRERAHARARGPRRRLPPEGQGARFTAGEGEEGAERPGKADKKIKGTTSEDASAPPPPLRERRRRPGRAVSAARLRGPAGLRPLPARPFCPALPLRSPLPGARVLRGFSAPLPPPLAASATAVLQAQPPSSAAPPPCSRPRARAHPSRRPRPSPARAGGRAPNSARARRERARLVSPWSGARGREKAGGAGAGDAGAALSVRAPYACAPRVAPVFLAGVASVSSGSVPEFRLRLPVCLWRGLAFPAPELSTRTTPFFEDDEMIRNPESGECAVTSRSFLRSLLTGRRNASRKEL